MDKHSDENEIVHCPKCGEYYDTLTQEIASYKCPHCSRKEDIRQKNKKLDTALKALKEKFHGNANK